MTLQLTEHLARVTIKFLLKIYLTILWSESTLKKPKLNRWKKRNLKGLTDPCAKPRLTSIYFYTCKEPHQIIWSSTKALVRKSPKPFRKRCHVLKFFVEGDFLVFLFACSAFQYLSKTNKFCLVSLRTFALQFKILSLTLQKYPPLTLL